MCTLAWGQRDDQLWVCFNRDEQRSRPVAIPPVLESIKGNPCVFARDPQGSGTWFAVSSRGFVVALLNYYSGSDEAAPAGARSRGEISLKMCEAEGMESAATFLHNLTLTAYAPFHLFLLSPSEVRSWSWNGQRLDDLDPGQPFWTSSSYRPKEVEQWRNAQLKTIMTDFETVSDVSRRMRRRDSARPTHGLTMDRESTRTVSQIEITLDSSGIRFVYHPREADGTGYGEPTLIEWTR
jgi:hypothetical protein